MSPLRGGRSFSFPLFFIRLRLYPTLFPSFLHGNGMRAMHLYKDISPPCSEVFRASAYVNEKMERKRMIRLWSEPGG